MNEVKRMISVIVVAMLFVAALLINVAARGDEQAKDPAAFYKSKCVACHGAKAEKKFDVTLTDEQMVDAVLKGNKPAKPPNMPGYGSKGVTAEQAKALVDHMKALKSAQ
jgi:mono/diheme cytochrome c family protein